MEIINTKIALLLTLTFGFLMAEDLWTNGTTIKERPNTRDLECPYPYGEDKIKEIYKKWQKKSSGTYVYIYKFSDYEIESIIYVRKNRITGYTKLSDIESNRTFKASMYNRDLHYLTNEIRKDSYLIKDAFDSAIHNCICFFYKVEIDKKYHYITALEMEMPYPVKCNFKIHQGSIPSPYSIYSYGLMMLPKDTKFTKKVVKRVVSKYKLALKCEKDMLKSAKEYDKKSLSALEKGIGRERAYCFKKYAIWNEQSKKSKHTSKE